MKDLVSIITPVHNGELFLGECMDSVLNQTYPYWEHVLVDDCSTDSSTAIISAYAAKDERIRLISLEVNSGAGISRNTAIEQARGAYIAFLDSDDSWYPTKLQEQLTFMEINGYPFTFTAYDKKDERGARFAKPAKAMRQVTYKQALFQNPLGCLTVMYDVRFFGKQYMPAIRKRQDYALWLKLLKKSDAYGLQKVLASYRVREHSVSSNKLGLLGYQWKVYREEEGLSFPESLFYMVSAVLLKMKSYF